MNGGIQVSSAVTVVSVWSWSLSTSSAYKRSDPKQRTLVTLSYYKATSSLAATVAHIAQASQSAGRDVHGWSEQQTFLRFSQRHGKLTDFFSPSFRGVLVRAHHFGEKFLWFLFFCDRKILSTHKRAVLNHLYTHKRAVLKFL